MSIPSCPHLSRCPGCPRYGARTAAPEALARLHELCERFGLTLVQWQGPLQGFRHRARLPVRGRARAPKIGIFERGSHQLVDVGQCRIHHPLINEVCKATKDALRGSQVTPYGESAHKGTVRGLQISVAAASNTAQVVVVCNESAPGPTTLAFLQRLRVLLGTRLHSLWWNGHTEISNRFLGVDFQHLHGPPFLEETLGGAEVYFAPGAFRQSNALGAQHAIETIHGWVPEAARVVELYAGSGAIGLGLLPRVRSLVLNEISPDALQGLQQGLRRLPQSQQDRVQVVKGSAELAVEHLREANVVIVDPPRKGLCSKVLEALLRDPPDRLIYLSCGLPALLCEVDRLQQAGLIPTCIMALDWFPFTEHVETLVHFQRTESA